MNSDKGVEGLRQKGDAWSETTVRATEREDTMRECFIATFALSNKHKALQLSLTSSLSFFITEESFLMSELLCCLTYPHLFHVSINQHLSLSFSLPLNSLLHVIYILPWFFLLLILLSLSASLSWFLCLFLARLTLFPIFLFCFRPALSSSQFFLSLSTFSVSLYCILSSSCLKVN